ncbi:MAG: ABC transporter permease [Cyanobacteria bacterium QS_4_48_99]|nr:MAG: ABC transporter permease [Cyanobacteria bacterium QS_4_48_99]
MFTQLFNRFLGSRFWALVVKEINQILKNRQLLFLLIFPPTIQLLIFGSSLDPQVQNLKLGIVDYANTSVTRELVSALSENQIFVADNYSFSEQALANQVEQGKITAGLVIPPDFNRQLQQGQTAEVQVLIDGVNANTASIAQGYITQIVRNYSSNLEVNATPPLVNPQVTFLYNPGLASSWFFVPGVIGLVLTLTGSLVSSATVVREKDTGTLEQLLMTPAAAWEILSAKIAPLFLLLMGDVLLALGIARLIFGVPFRGSWAFFLATSALYVFVGIGVGILLATISKNQQQVVLTSFFINIPVIQLSGAIAPIESMPTFFQYLSLLDPLRHYIAISRSVLLKGVGWEALGLNVLALGAIAILLLTISIKQFRTQLN